MDNIKLNVGDLFTYSWRNTGQQRIFLFVDNDTLICVYATEPYKSIKPGTKERFKALLTIIDAGMAKDVYVI